MPTSSIKTAIFWANGSTTVYDDRGEPMHQYQGQLSKTGPRIVADAPPDARFYISSWSGGGVLCYRAEIESLVAQVARWS